ncbi:MAG: DsrE family protein [Kofleriaceae bacterium]|jgi:hypothetical protein|nr:DsrE family protein [Kofleriaceae bacterium]MBP6837207.1 DsrE family protein [Kofleriaceae bacterium]MBP9205508.1 DsrE family protein [Kofleriaceae bacterium]
MTAAVTTVRFAIVVARADDWPTARALGLAARRQDHEVALFVMADAVGALAGDGPGREALLDADCALVACATSAHGLGLGPDQLGDEVLLGSQDDHAAILARADRVVALT